MILEQPINKLISEYVSEMDAKPYVQKNTLWVLQRFVNWMVRAGVNVKQPRKADIIHYKNTLITEGKTPTTINRYLAPVRGLFRWLEESRLYDNIAAGVRSPKDTRAFRKEYLNPNQVIQLLDSIKTDSITGLRNYAMINLMVCTGLRRCEVLRLTVADISGTYTDAVLSVHRKGKITKEAIRIPYEVFEPIEQYLCKRGAYSNNDPLFANHSQHQTNKLSDTVMSAIVKHYLKKLSNSRKLTCHSLRHSAAINLLKSGRSLYDVQMTLGHESVKTTEIYLKAIEAEQRYYNPAGHDLARLYQKQDKTGQKQPETV